MGMAMPVLRYLGQIWWKIPGSWKQKKQILSCAATPVRDYAERNPQGDYGALIQRFGTPEQVVEAYLTDMDVEELSKQLHISKKIVTIVGATALAVVIMWACTVSILLIDSFNDTNGFIVESVEVMSEEEYLEMNGGTE